MGLVELWSRLDWTRPGLLWLGVVTVVGVAVLAYVRGPLRILVPTHAVSGDPSAGEGDPVFWADLCLWALVVVLLSSVLAGPSVRLPAEPAAGSGVDLVVALDASGSMDALDGVLEGARVSRLELAKRAVAALVREREGDRIGLVVFGQRAYTQCPLTLDHSLVLRALDRVRIGDAGDSTAIGDAVGLAVRRLRAEGARADAQRILVLMTDGRQNSGSITPDTAARLAVREGVRTHTVGIGTDGVVPFSGDPRESALRFERVDLDRQPLERLARATGGEFFAARRPEDVLAITESIHEIEARPPAEPGAERHVSLIPALSLAALLLLGFEVALGLGWFRRLP